MRRLAFALALGAAVGALQAPAATPAFAQASDTMIVGFVDPPAGLDPALAVLGASHQIIDLVYSGLTKLNNNAEPEPDLAESWELDPTGTIYTFHLRPGVKFHDGTPLTAADVVTTFARLTDPATGYAYATQVESVKEVKAIDDATVQITLSQPTGPFLTFLAFPGNFIVPKHLAEGGSTLTNTPIGTGPYKFVSYSPGQSLILERYDDYHFEGLPKLARLDIRYIADDTERANALLGGSIDFASRVGPKDYDMIVETPGMVGTSFSGGRWFWIMTNDTVEPTNNPLVRTAISYALDRQAMADILFFGHAQPITSGPIPDWSWAYDPATAVIPPTGDVEKAKELLAQAGFPNGLTIQMTLGSTWQNLADQGPLIKDQLARAGITVELQTMENPRYMDLVWNGGQYQISNMYWLSPLADPDDFLYLNYRCGSGMNPQKYCNEALDTLLQQARYTATEADRKPIYAEATKLLMQETPLIPTVNAMVLDAHSERVKGWEPMRTGMYRNLINATLE